MVDMIVSIFGRIGLQLGPVGCQFWFTVTLNFDVGNGLRSG
jgi:hypothetical protein